MELLHLRASRWYQANGQLAPAIEHALAGHAFEQAAALIELAAEPVFTSGQLATLLRWLELLPAEAKDGHSSLWIFHGLSLIWLGKSSTAVRPLLPGLKLTFEKDGFMGEAQVLQALYAMAEGRPVEAVQLAQSALSELRNVERPLFRCLAADALGMANILISETTPAIHAFEQLAGLAAQAGYGMFEIVALSHLAGLHLQYGRLNAAESGYARALELAVQKMGRCSPVVGNVVLGLGELAREKNDLEAALGYFEEALELFAQFIEMGVPIAYLSIARVKAAQEDWKSAQAALDQARQAAQASNITRMNDRLVNGMQARIWIGQGALDLAHGWAQAGGLFDRSIAQIVQAAGLKVAGSEFVFSDYLTLARLYLAQNKAESALQVLADLLDVARNMGFIRREIHVLVLQALALRQQEKQGGPAVEKLGLALDLAAAEGYVRVFLDEGEPLAQFLYQAAQRGHSPAYAKKILASLKPGSSPGPATGEMDHPKESLLEPLSEREREVLALLAAGLSNREIALRLHISLSTVKGHTANIYGKLGVTSRTQAVAEGARLGILKP